MSFDLADLESSYYEWDRNTSPEVVRFIRDRYDDENIEVECIAIDPETGELERQGIMYIIPVVNVMNLLRKIGLTATLPLEQAIDAAWNFLHSVYYVESDRFEIR